MPKIEKEEVRKLANLSRLELSESELDKFVTEFEATLREVEKINKICTDQVQLYEDTLDAQYQLRPDVVVESLPQALVVANAPQSENGSFLVPTTVEEDI